MTYSHMVKLIQVQKMNNRCINIDIYIKNEKPRDISFLSRNCDEEKKKKKKEFQ